MGFQFLEQVECSAADLFGRFVGRDVEPGDAAKGLEPGSLAFCKSSGVDFYFFDCFFE